MRPPASPPVLAPSAVAPRAAALLFALSLAVVPAGALAQVLVQAAPSQFDLELLPGRRESRALILHNLGRQSVRVAVSLSDLRMNERGALDLLPAGTLESTLARIVVFAPRELRLGPGERRAVRLEMMLPLGGAATRCGVVLCRVTPTKPDDAAGAPSAPAELGTTVFLTRVPRASIRAELSNLDADVNPDGNVVVEVRVRNRSQRHASCHGEVKLTDSTGATMISGFLPDGVVLPGAARVFGWNGARRLPAGRYLVTVTIDTGEPELLVGQKEVVVGRRGPSAARDD